MRGLTAALGQGFKYKTPQSAVDHLVIGGGVVGLAIAQRLATTRPDKSTYVIERHKRAGEETSSRNSEVIHAGIYYRPNSLKSRLCIRGRRLLYSYCDTHSVPYKKLGKLIVALPHQVEYLEKLHAQCNSLQNPRRQGSGVAVPTQLIRGDQARQMEPDLSPDITLAMWSSETGIIDSHALIDSLEGDVESSENGEVVYGTRVVRVDPSPEGEAASGESGWVVQTVTGDGAGEPDAIACKTLINASGLSSQQALNQLLPRLDPPEPLIPIYYAKGSYAAYRGPGVGQVKHLIYPVPEQATKHGFHSLGTHLTLDMDGNVRFGPDIDWLEPPGSSTTSLTGHSYEPNDIDYWNRHLAPSPEHMPEMHKSITTFLPNVTLEGLSPDYVGIRPKMVGPEEGFQDFVIRVDRAGRWTSRTKDSGPQMITLLGIESPGLTSCLAIAEMVTDEVMDKA